MSEATYQTKRRSAFAMRAPAFRLYTYGNLLSSSGDWLDLVALNWVILQRTNSPLILGILNACRLLPIFLMSVPAGILSDRYDRRNLLRLLQIGIFITTVGLTVCLQTACAWPIVCVVVVVRALLQAMDPPIRQSMLPNLVEEVQMGSAIALNTVVLNISRMIGPALAGLLLSHLNGLWLLLINAGTVLFEYLMLTMLRVEQQTIATKSRSLKKENDLREVVQYLKETKTVRSLLVLAVVPMVFGFPYTAMMPLFAQSLLGLGSAGFGLLLSVAATGAIVSSTWLSFGRQTCVGRWLIASLLGFGVAWIVFLTASEFRYAAGAMFFVGLCGQLYRTMSRMTIQLQVPDSLRGRVMSIALLDRGFISLGVMLIGWVASLWNVFGAGLMMGIGCIVITLFVLAVQQEIWKMEVPREM